MEDVGRFLFGLPHDEGNHALAQGAGKRKVLPHFAGEERMTKALHGATSQQIGVSAPFEFPGARSREDETQSRLRVDEFVDDVQKGRNALDFVDDESIRSVPPLHDFGKPLRLHQELAPDGRGQKVDDNGIRECFLEPCGLARSARTEEEKAAVGTENGTEFRFHGDETSIFSDGMSRLFYSANGKTDADFTEPSEKSRLWTC